jgi:DNA-binding IclR family transcriptional regulator
MFLTNHAHVLFCLFRRPEATLREIGDRVGLTERAVHRIIDELVGAGAVRRFRNGRRNRYEIDPDFAVEDVPSESVRVRDLLRAAKLEPSASPPLPSVRPEAAGSARSR